METGRDIQFKLSIKMESDWHIGLGAGRQGAVDSLVRRDGDDIPYIPASTLRGMWRDAAERLAYGLDDGIEKNGVWAKLLPEIFGSQPALLSSDDVYDAKAPKKSRLSLSSARFEDVLLEQLKGKDGIALLRRQALTMVKPGVEIAEGTGVAIQDHLRFEEMVRKGSVLEASVSLNDFNFEDEQEKKRLALLIGSLSLLDRIGGKRRRGSGKCDVTVKGVGDELRQWAFGILSEIGEKESVLPDAIFATETDLLNKRAAHDAKKHWLSLDLKIRANSHLIIPSSICGNVTLTEDYIPGTYLLSAIASVFKKNGFDPWPYIFDGRIRVLPSYVSADDTSKTYPVPCSFFAKKVEDDRDSERTVLNCLFEDARKELSNSRDDKKENDEENKDKKKEADQYKQMRNGYISVSPDRNKILSVRKTMITHNTVEDESQRPTTEVGGVYSYEAIKSGQNFEGRLFIHRDVVSEMGGDLNNFGECKAKIGRASSAGYGDVSISFSQSDYNQDFYALEDNSCFILLLSDVLIRAENLGYQTTDKCLASEILKAAGIDADVNSVIGYKNLRTRRIESWQNSWGLPRPTLVAIQAGSVIEIKSEQLNKDNLERISFEGIGERVAEGYGSICVLPSELNKDRVTLVIKETDGDEGNSEIVTYGAINKDGMDDGLKQYAEQIDRVVWQSLILEKVELLSGDEGKRKEILGWSADKPSMSQLGTLCSKLQYLSKDGGDKTLIDWLCKLDGDEKRKNKWGEDSLKKLQNLVKNKTDIWTHLNKEGGGISYPDDLVSNDEAWEFAVRSLILSAIHYHKRNIETKDTSEGIAA